MNGKKLRANLLLILTAFIWGMAFVAQSRGMDSCGPFLFNGVRMLIGSLVLLPVITRMDKTNARPPSEKVWPVAGGICCGLVLFAASSLQQIGIIGSGAGKAGFITALYVVLVPIFGLVLGRRATILTWLSVVVALFGMYLLCMDSTTLRILTSDFLLLGCAILFAVHILVIDHFAPKVDCVRMSCLQFFTTGVCAMVAAILLEEIRLADILAAAVPLLYTGVLSSGVAYTLQIVAQKNTDPTSAALLCSLESVFALFGGWLLMGEVFSGREIWGCVLTFGAIILSQLPIFQHRKV
ncbi:MAG: DMT family transporter [Ruminococcaceae bacterium]|nr:DMT family transporter [Oscillospiraceae bacterium]